MTARITMYGAYTLDSSPNHTRDRVASKRTRLYDLHKLVHSAIAREQGLSKQQFRRHTPQAPCIDGARVVRRAEYEFRCSVVPAQPAISLPRHTQPRRSIGCEAYAQPFELNAHAPQHAPQGTPMWVDVTRPTKHITASFTRNNGHSFAFRPCTRAPAVGTI